MQLFLNNWRSQLASPLASTSLTMQVHADDAALLAGLGSGGHYLLTLAGVDAGGVETAHEIVRVTANAAGSLTIARAQEGTAAAEWPISTPIECRFTAGAALAPAAALAGHTAAADPHTQYQQKEVGKGLSTNDYTADEKNKLANLESSHYKGLYSSLEALQAAKPSGAAGDYADVDAGVGSDVQRYLWDVSDAGWKQLGASTPMTATQIKVEYESNADTNAFTDAEKAKLAALQSGGAPGDVLLTLRDPGADYVLPDATYLQAAYPDLFAELGLLGSTPNNGATWEVKSFGAALDGYGSAIDSLTGLATDGNGVWIGGHWSGVFVRSTDNGATWASVAAGEPESGTAPARVYTDRNGVWLATIDGGGLGLLRSMDSGATWTHLDSLPPFSALAYGNGVWMASAGSETRRSIDGGLTWSIIDDGVATAGWSPYMFATNGAGVWVGWGSNGSTGRYIITSADNGVTWTQGANPVASNNDASAIDYSGGAFVLAGATNGAIYRSSDNGATWASVVTLTGGVVAFASNNAVILAASSYAIARSTDHGATWVEVSIAGLVSNYPQSIAMSETTAIASAYITGGGQFIASVSSFPYDEATEFYVPAVTAPEGAAAYIRATA